MNNPTPEEYKKICDALEYVGVTQCILLFPIKDKDKTVTQIIAKDITSAGVHHILIDCAKRFSPNLPSVKIPLE